VLKSYSLAEHTALMRWPGEPSKDDKHLWCKQFQSMGNPGNAWAAALQSAPSSQVTFD
jgi:hypothetical protein